MHPRQVTGGAFAIAMTQARCKLVLARYAMITGSRAAVEELFTDEARSLKRVITRRQSELASRTARAWIGSATWRSRAPAKEPVEHRERRSEQTSWNEFDAVLYDQWQERRCAAPPDASAVIATIAIYLT